MNPGVILIISFFLASLSSFSQEKKVIKDEVTKKLSLAVELGAFMVRQGRIITYEGSYRVRSHIQSSYLAGGNVIYKLSDAVQISTGLQLEIGKRNYLMSLTAEDDAFFGGFEYLEGKDLWKVLRVPLTARFYLPKKRRMPAFIKSGITLSYTGRNKDSDGTWYAYGTDGSRYRIFDVSFVYKKQPWLYYIGGFGKDIPLKQNQELSITVQLQYSPTYLCIGEFQVTMPNKPITRGRYQTTGSGIGLVVQYVF